MRDASTGRADGGSLLGNALVQARALGVLSGPLPEFRATVRRSVRCAEYEPHEAAARDDAEKFLDGFTDAPS